MNIENRVYVKIGHSPFEFESERERDFFSYMEIVIRDYLPKQCEVSNFRYDGRYLMCDYKDTIHSTDESVGYVQGIMTGFLMGNNFELR